MTQIDMNLINKVSDLIEVLNGIKEKTLNFPFQNYFHVNVFMTTVEPPEHDRTYVLGKSKKWN